MYEFRLVTAIKGTMWTFFSANCNSSLSWMFCQHHERRSRDTDALSREMSQFSTRLVEKGFEVCLRTRLFTEMEKKVVINARKDCLTREAPILHRTCKTSVDASIFSIVNRTLLHELHPFCLFLAGLSLSYIFVQARCNFSGKLW